MTTPRLILAALALVAGVALTDHLLGDLAARVHTTQQQALEQQP